MKRPRCKNDQHDDRPMRGGKHSRCAKCGDVFPCRHDCHHLDCASEREPKNVEAAS